METKRKSIFLQVLPYVSLVLILLVWLACSSTINSALILPSPYQVCVKCFELLCQKSTYTAIFGTVLRVLISFCVCFVTAVSLATLATFFRPLDGALYPFLIIARAMPTMCILFLCLVWFSDFVSPMLVAVLVIFPMLYSSTKTAINGVDKNLVQMSNVYKVPKRVQLRSLFVPSVANRLFDDAVSAMGLSVKLIISAEAISRTGGSLGRFMSVSKGALETAELFAYTVIAVLIALAFELVLKLIKKLAKGVQNADHN